MAESGLEPRQATLPTFSPSSFITQGPEKCSEHFFSIARIHDVLCLLLDYSTRVQYRITISVREYMRVLLNIPQDFKKRVSC